MSDLLLDRTLTWYQANAETYRARTHALVLDERRAEFLAMLPGAPPRILDAGCGSGRDTQAFLAAGADCLPMEPVPALADGVERLTGRPVLRQTFEDFTMTDTFDGIWAMASLVHVPRLRQAFVMTKLAAALRPGGVLFACWKAGAGERWEADGRFFCDVDEETADGLAKETGLLTTIVLRRGQDAGRRTTDWVEGYWRRTALL